MPRIDPPMIRPRVKGDVVIGGPNGSPIILPAGIDGATLTLSDGSPAWIEPAPTYTQEQIDPIISPLANPGLDTQVLRVVDGNIEWSDEVDAYTKAESDALLELYAAVDHIHLIDEVDGLGIALDERSLVGHTHNATEIAGVDDIIASGISGIDLEVLGAAPAIHTHEIADVTGLQAALDTIDVDVSWDDVSGKPTEFSPAPHAHDVTDITATGTRTASTYLRGDGVWSSPTNTMYSEISTAEIDAGYGATSSRLISGRRAQYLLEKAQTTVPTPTADTHAANKKYVDDHIGGGGGGGAVDSVNGQTGVVVLDAEDVGAAGSGHQHQGVDSSSVALGESVNASGSAVAIGFYAEAINGGTSLGRYSGAKDSGTAVGGFSSSEDYGTALGTYAAVGDEFGLAAGSHAYAGGHAIALGFKAFNNDSHTAVVTAHTLTLEDRAESWPNGPTQEAGSIKMYNAANELVSIGVNATKKLTVDGVEMGGVALAGDGVATTAARSDHGHKGTGLNSVQVGEGADAYGDSATAIGAPSYATMEGATAVGRSALVDHEYATAIGANAGSYGDYALSIGAFASTFSLGAIAIGSIVNAFGQDAIALGRGSGAIKDESIAIGSYAKADHPRSIVIGDSVESTGPNSAIIAAHTLELQDIDSTYSPATTPSTLRLYDAGGVQVDVGVNAAKKLTVDGVEMTHTIAGLVNFELHGELAAGDEAFVRMNFPGTWTGWSIYSRQTGSIVLDIQKDTHANFPPVVGDSVAGTDKPTISSGNKNESTSLTGWVTSFSSGDVIRVAVDSVTTIEDVYVSLWYERGI